MRKKLHLATVGGLLAAWSTWVVHAFQNSSLTFWAGYWLFWFFGVFLVPELYWAKVNANNTVSDNTWRFENLDRAHPYDFAHWTPVHWIFGLVFLYFAIRLGLHLVFGLPLFRFGR